MTLAILWLAGFLVLLAFCTTSVLVARAVGAKIEHVAIFVGPPVLRLPVAGFRVLVGAVPVPGGHLTFEAAPTDDDPNRTQLDDLSQGRRAAIFLFPWLAIALATVVVLGPTVGLGAIGRGFVQFVAGAASPTETGRTLVATLFELARNAPFHVFASLVATKMVAFNLLPLPGLAGRAVVLELAGRSYRARLPSWLSIASVLAMAALVLLWLWAVIAYFRS